MNTLDYRDLSISYRISSALGCRENNRYNQNIIGKIDLINDYGESIETIGKIKANKLLVQLGADNGWDAFSIFDTEAHLFEIGEAIFDFASSDWHPELTKHYANDIEGQNILILSRIEIIPKYRGKGFAPFIIKDLYNNFIDGMAFFVLKAFPIQFEASILGSKSENSKAMEYDKMEKNIKQATRKLISFYTKLGFEIIPSLSKEIMFINPTRINRKLDKITLD